MARKRTRKPKVPKGWTSKEYAKLKSDIANYNERIRRARKKGTGDYIEMLPDTVTLSEMLALGNKKEIKKAQKNLSLYNAKTLAPTLINTLVVPAFKVKIINQNLEAENRRRAELQEAVSAKPREGRFITQTDVDVKKLDISKVGPQTIKELANLDYTPIIDTRALKYQQNYINKLNAIEEQIYMAGIDDDLVEEAANLIEQIRNLVEELNPSQFYLAQLSVPNANMQVLYKGDLLVSGLSEIYSSWENFRTNYVW